MNARQRALRFLAIKCLGCMACRRAVYLGLIAITAIAEVHHLNEDGHAGQARRGDEYTIGLCKWHHRGEPPFPSITVTQATKLYGPSLKHEPRRFREVYGSDDALLEKQDQLIAMEVA